MSGKRTTTRPVIISPTEKDIVWSESQMLEIVSTIKWFRSFNDESEMSFFASSPSQETIPISSLGLTIAGSLLEDSKINLKIWILNSLDATKHSWVIMPTGANLGLWQNSGLTDYVPRFR